MAELTNAPETNTNTCCAPEAQANCCEPNEKADCCGHDDGCNCNQGHLSQDTGRLAQAAVIVSLVSCAQSLA